MQTNMHTVWRKITGTVDCWDWVHHQRQHATFTAVKNLTSLSRPSVSRQTSFFLQQLPWNGLSSIPFTSWSCHPRISPSPSDETTTTHVNYTWYSRAWPQYISRGLRLRLTRNVIMSLPLPMTHLQSHLMRLWLISGAALLIRYRYSSVSEWCSLNFRRVWIRRYRVDWTLLLQ